MKNINYENNKLKSHKIKRKTASNKRLQFDNVQNDHTVFTNRQRYFSNSGYRNSLAVMTLINNGAGGQLFLTL